MSFGSMGRYGTSQVVSLSSSQVTSELVASGRTVCASASSPLLIASWWEPENAVKTRSPP